MRNYIYIYTSYIIYNIYAIPKNIIAHSASQTYRPFYNGLLSCEPGEIIYVSKYCGVQ